eukprot:snap_masked-scaffold_37-processed-gene-2.47-mRNA-1 protein AED:1.00 eAED:1.00 QI:0/0/0/0/1/1/3/0/260
MMLVFGFLSHTCLGVYSLLLLLYYPNIRIPKIEIAATWLRSAGGYFFVMFTFYLLKTFVAALPVKNFVFIFEHDYVMEASGKYMPFIITLSKCTALFGSLTSGLVSTIGAARKDNNLLHLGSLLLMILLFLLTVEFVVFQKLMITKLKKVFNKCLEYSYSQVRQDEDLAPYVKRSQRNVTKIPFLLRTVSLLDFAASCGGGFAIIWMPLCVLSGLIYQYVFWDLILLSAVFGYLLAANITITRTEGGLSIRNTQGTSVAE